MIITYRPAKETFIIAAIRSNGLSLIRIGICPTIIDEKIPAEYTVLCDTIPPDVNEEYRYIHQVNTDTDYLSVPRLAEKFKAALAEIGALKIPVASVVDYRAKVKLPPEEKLTILFHKNRNITMHFRQQNVFDLFNELSKPFTSGHPDLIRLLKLLNLSRADTENLGLLTSPPLKEKYRQMLFSDLRSCDINPSVDRLTLTYAENGKNISLDFQNNIPVTFTYPVDNTIFIRTAEKLPFDVELDIGIKQNENYFEKIPLKIMGKTDGSGLTTYRCHPVYFENYVLQVIQKMEKFVRFGFISQI